MRSGTNERVCEYVFIFFKGGYPFVFECIRRVVVKDDCAYNIVRKERSAGASDAFPRSKVLFTVVKALILFRDVRACRQ